MAEQSGSLTALLSSVAAILNSVAWPGIAIWFLATHKARIKLLLKVLVRKLSSAKKVKVGQLELEEFEEEVKEAVIKAGTQIDDIGPSKTVPKNQIEAAANLDEKVRTAGIPQLEVRDTVRREIYELAQQYEAVRATLPSGNPRTKKMNEIAAGMRTLGITGLQLRTKLMKSDSVGRRLAAICMLQVKPRRRYLNWLIERVETESQPFIFFQAALAISEAVRRNLYSDPEALRSRIADARRKIAMFQGGEPDTSTIVVLDEALELIH